jgi:Lar family restriction alleviation protein
MSITTATAIATTRHGATDMTSTLDDARGELLACPFCGSTRVGIGASQDDPATQWSVICSGCGSSCSLYCETEQEAVASWNTRAAPVPQCDAEAPKPMLRGQSHPTLAIPLTINSRRELPRRA